MERPLARMTLAIALLGGCRGVDSSPPDAKAAACTTTPLHVTGAVVLTMDDAQPEASELWIVEDRVVALSRDDAIARGVSIGCASEVSAGGDAIVPGFIDGHVHVRELGMDALKADLVGVTNVDAMVARLRARFPEPEPGVWLIGQGWDEGAFGSRGYPDRAALDAAFPDNPVALESLHGFAGFFNGAALEIAAIDANTPDPEAGTILRRDDGAPTGVMLTLAQGLVMQHVPPATGAQLEAAIVAGLSAMAAEGVTSVHEAGMSSADVAAFERLADAGRLPIRVYGMLSGNEEALMRTWFDRGPLDHPSGMLDVRAIKVFYDGSLGSRTAVLAQPYADEPHAAKPAERISPERMASLAERAVTHGFQMAVHAIGDEGNRRTLKVFADALAAKPGVDHRWRIEHAQVVLPDFFTEAARLGVIASMQPSHAVGDSAWAEDRLGPERVKRAYAWRSMLDAGVRLILNSDLPGEPWRPAETLFFAVTRSKLDGTPEGGWYPEQALTVDETLRAMTSDAAHAAFAEEELGVLRPGMKADFVVLDRDPRAVSPLDLKDLQVVSTWVDGTRVP